MSIWRAAVAVDPSPTAHQTLANALLERGHGVEAEGHLRAEAAQRPDRMVTHVMLWLSLEHRGAHAEAEVERLLVEKMATARFGPGLDPAVTNRGDMIQGVVLPPQPDLARKLGIAGAARDASR